MKIADKKAVAIEFTLKDDAGELIETSVGKDSLWYMQGLGNLVPGLEKALEGKAKGDTIDVKLSPAEGYGVPDPKQVRKIPLRKLKAQRIQVGGRYQVQTDDGVRVVVVKAVSGDYAQVDGNHPLSGKALQFIVKVVDVRDATKDEQEHGHVHDGGGHGHEHHGHDHDHDHDHDH